MRRGVLTRLAGVLLVLVVAAGCAPGTERTAQVIPTLRIEPAAPKPKPDIEAERQKFFQETVLPELQKLEARNQEAAKRCIDRIRAAFRRYRKGVPQFVEDVMSWRTRIVMLFRLTGQWIWKDNRVEEYIRPKFERYVFSEWKLRRDLENALRGYREDVRANISEFYVAVKVAAEDSDAYLWATPLPQADAFARWVHEAATKLARDQAVESLESAVITFVLSEVATIAATELLVQLTVSTAAGVLSTTTFGLASTTTGAAVGGATGGPIGFIVGLGVGVAVDWWLSSKHERELKRQLYAFLAKAERGVVYGANGKSGLRAALYESGHQIRRAVEAATRRAVFGEDKGL